jgi:hypothetical protein
MEKIYVSLEDIWPMVQEDFEKARARNDVQGMNWCNRFQWIIGLADHQRIEVKEND